MGMAKVTQSSQNKKVNQMFGMLAVIAGVSILVISGLAWQTHNFVSNMVKTELASQKIYFPPAGSPALSPSEFPDLQKYAGQLVDSPEEAKAYANGFIGRHLKKVASGKVYSEVSAEAMKDPTNPALQQQTQILFQGETLRGILLGNGYAFGVIGNIAGIVSAVTLGIGALVLCLAVYLVRNKR